MTMNNCREPPSNSVMVVLLTLGAAAAVAYFYFGRSASSSPDASLATTERDPSLRRPAATSPLEIEDFCSRCHAFPPADTFPRSAWKQEVEKAYKIIAQSNVYLKPVPLEHVLHYYEERAPLELLLPIL